MKRVCLMIFMLIPVMQATLAQHRISGFVVSLESARPVEGASVYLMDEYGLALDKPHRTQTDSSGFYSIRGIKTGNYTFHAWTSYESDGDTYANVLQSKVLTIDDDLTIDLVFSKNAFYFWLDMINNYKQGDIFKKKTEPRTYHDVARMGIRSQIFLNSKRDTIFADFFQKIDLDRKQVIR